jgi:hypothetical protein
MKPGSIVITAWPVAGLVSNKLQGLFEKISVDSPCAFSVKEPRISLATNEIILSEFSGRFS